MGGLEPRRSHDELDTGATAVIFRRGDAVGRYVVQKLSTEGALLTGGSELDRGKPVHVLLTLPDGRKPIGMVGCVHNVARGPEGVFAVDVRFPHMRPAVEDRIQNLVLSALEVASR
jgi:hypothetical protein